MRRTLTFCFLLSLATTSHAQFGRPQDRDADARNIEYLLTEAEKQYLIEDYAQALSGFLKVLEEDKENPVANYKIAEIYQREEKHEEALLFAQAALDGDPENKYYYIQLADIHARLTNYGSAAKVYEELIDNIPNSDEYLYELAALYLFQRDIDKGLKTYRRIEEAYGKSPEVSYQVQKILIAQNKVEAAIEEAEELIEAYEGEPEYVLALVELLLNQGMSDRAIPHLESLVVDYPDNKRAQLVLSSLFLSQGKAERGLPYLQSAITDPQLEIEEKLRLLTGYILDLPNEALESGLRDACVSLIEVHPAAHQAFGIYGDLLFQLGEQTAARDQYLKGVKIDAGNFEVWQNIVAIDWNQQEYDLVIEHTDEALAMFPNQAALYYYNGHAHYLKKGYDDAIFALEQGKRLAFRNPELQGVFYGLLGDAYNATKDYTKSDRAYEDALKLNPDNTLVLNNFSYFLSLRRQNLNRALELSTHLVELEPQNATFLDTHAWVLYQLGEYREAADYLKRAVNQGDPSGTILEHYGDALFKLNRVDEAMKQWELALEKGGYSTLLEQKISDRQLYENQ